MVFRPPGRARGGVVVCHEIWGITTPLLSAARALAAAGFLVTVPDFYAEVDRPQGPASDEQARHWRDGLEVAGIGEVLAEAIGWLRVEGAPRVGVLGCSMGGAVALWAAAALDIDAAVTFYGGGLLEPYWPGMPAGVVLAARLSTRWRGCYGGRDPLTPADALRRLRVALDGGSGLGTAVVFDDLDHGFALDPTDPRYAPDEAAATWRDALAFLERPPG
ncbi:carboxymethylenebutenolidase [Amycolatopsis arida]|uniref:Carboxymethylenebutenolidase n=2 Tax=Amycolatopsis arida TaxID=587909 RepID=A0A1I5YXK0_9PSEU|nr:carboxymethylenebutenolidase [Amycolatopsis arida]SFQ48959.1 carboxymethylenebutenolidase [Amycolatopsis arida]